MAKTTKAYDVADMSKAKEGKRRIEWAAREMQVLGSIKETYEKTKPFRGLTIGACLHVTTETANLMTTLAAGGAKVALCASNPLSTQDDVAASLVKDYDIQVFAVHGEDATTYYKHIDQVLDLHPRVTMDDGADVVSRLHQERTDQLEEVVGSSEETTTGVIRLKAMAADGALKLPVVAVNDSDTKHLFDNRYGTGQSTIDGIIRATNVLFAGKTVVVGGYGYCSRGIATRAAGMGANVVVTEVNPVRALEAAMDGYRVMPMKQAAKIGDIFISATGDKSVISLEHMKLMKSGAMMANSGHFDVELEYAALKKASKGGAREVREHVEEFVLGDKKLYVIGQGRLVNLAAGEGHPAEVMDMSFANQAFAAEWLLANEGKLKHEVYRLPEKFDAQIAKLKLKSMGISIDKLTPGQKRYLTTWTEGT